MSGINIEYELGTDGGLLPGVALVAKTPSIRRFYTLHGFHFAPTEWGHGARMLATKIGRDCQNGSFRPDLIVEIVPGGKIVGALLAGNYSASVVNPNGDLPIMLPMTPQRCKKNDETFVEFRPDELKLYKSVFRGAQVLVIDGEVFTGRTLSAAKTTIMRLGAAKVRTAAIYQRKNIAVTADYFAEERQSSERIVKPWKLEPHHYGLLWE